jgi:hypothetical protein
MRSKKITISPGMLLVLVVVFMLGLASAATAGSLINGKKIKKGSIPLSALSSDAQKKLKGKAGSQGPQGPQGGPGAAAARYWAFITDSGSVGRSSGGVTALFTTNGNTNKQYQVRFPTDISQCSFGVTTGDTDPIGAGFAVDGLVPAISRSSVDSNTVAITLWLRNTPNGSYVNTNMGQANFYVQAFC